MDKINKKCTKCGDVKDITDFTINNQQSSGYHPSCKECVREYSREYREKNEELIKERERKRRKSSKFLSYQLNYLYGITIQEYDSMYIEQGGCCAICGIHQSKLKRRLCVDHCHESNKIRGLLCINCNKGLGHFYDDLTFLHNAILYLKQDG